MTSFINITGYVPYVSELKNDTFLNFYNVHAVDMTPALIGADLDAVVSASDGCTPLYVAVQLGNSEAASVLCECGADPNLCAVDGAGPIRTTSLPQFSAHPPHHPPPNTNPLSHPPLTAPQTSLPSEEMPS